MTTPGVSQNTASPLADWHHHRPRFRGPDPLTLSPLLYPDLQRSGIHWPEALAAEARAWVAAAPLRWRPEPVASGWPDPLREPLVILAILGALALTAAIRRPAGWTGEALHGPDDLMMVIGAAAMRGTTVKGEEAQLVTVDGAPRLVMRHLSSRLWSGRVTIGLIWESCAAALPPPQPSHDPKDEPERPVTAVYAPLDYQLETEPVTVTGYDDSVVGDGAQLGTSLAKHGIRIVGARPALELYALIGASELEAAGRWLSPHRLSLPRLAGVVLRDWLDAQRWLMLGDDEPVIVEQAGKRSYLRAP